MKWFQAGVIVFVASVAANAIAAAGRATVPQDACLHGANETADQAARRQAALAFTRHVNTVQAQTSAKNNGYSGLKDLSLNRPVPDGFALSMSTANLQLPTPEMSKFGSWELGIGS